MFNRHSYAFKLLETSLRKHLCSTTNAKLPEGMGQLTQSDKVRNWLDDCPAFPEDGETVISSNTAVGTRMETDKRNQAASSPRRNVLSDVACVPAVNDEIRVVSDIGNGCHQPDSTAATEREKQKDTKSTARGKNKSVSKRETVTSSTVEVSCTTKWNKKGRCANDKRYACKFCDGLYYQLPRHYCVCRDASERDIAELSAKKGKERQDLLSEWKNEGSFKHNIRVLKEGKGKLIVARRATRTVSSDKYLPCVHCLAFFYVRDLWRHSRNCSKNSSSNCDAPRASIRSASRILLLSAVEADCSLASPDLKKHVLSRMQSGKISCVVKSDNLILQFGSALIRRLGPYRATDICQRMRQLARLKLVLNEGKREKNLATFINAKSFDVVMGAVEELCVMESDAFGRRIFKKPSTALKLGHSLMKCAVIKKGNGVRDGDGTCEKEAESYIHLHSSEWTDNISSPCLYSLRANKFNKPELQPLSSDLLKMKEYEVDMIQKLTEKLLSDENYSTWRLLAEMTLARLTQFNCRRVSEPAKLLLSTYLEKPNWSKDCNAEMLKSLSDLERKLMER